MMHWMITVGLVTIAYWLGFRHGEAYCQNQMNRILNKIAFKLGVPKDEPFWGRSHGSWEQAFQDVKAQLEKQVNTEQ